MCNCEANKLQIDKIYTGKAGAILSIAVAMSCKCGKEHCFKIFYSHDGSDNYPEPNVVDRSYTCRQ